MAEFKLGRIRFVWKDAWSTGTSYYKDDVVRFGGRIYICVIGHTAAADFFTDFEVVPPKWNLVSDGQTWKGSWTPDTGYVYGDIVSYGARLYIANAVHTSDSSLLENDQANWDLFAEGLDWKGNWNVDTYYKANDIVKYGGTTYVCNTPHTSAATDSDGLELDQAKWDIFNQGIEYKQTWTVGERYKVNDVVQYGAALWICTGAHTATSLFSDDEVNWEQFVRGFQFESDWETYRVYQPGDIVRYGGNQYIAKTNNSEKNPFTETADWEVFTQGMRFLGDWQEDSTLQDYRVGEVVRYGGYTYLCIQDHQDQAPTETAYWTRLNSGLRWRADWADDQEYVLGDIVRFNNNAYICVLGHLSEQDDGSTQIPQVSGAANSRPDQDITGTYWNILTIGAETNVLTTKGDMVYYAGAGPTRLPIGEEGQVLKVSSDSVPEWAYLGVADDVYYVATHGADKLAPAYGRTIDKPWKSIRYACQQVDNGVKNPNARRLLENNRLFIQREIVEFVDAQIAGNIAPFSIGMDYDSAKCGRDMGLIIDAVIWDITHGGNVRTREAALKYANDAAQVYVKDQDEETVAAINYGLTVIQDVLNQEVPDVNYQVANGDNSTAIIDQWFDSSITSEAGVYAEIVSLVKPITDTITAGDDSAIPGRIIRNVLIKVSTGKYQEVLPIIVPAETCVIGDELRSVTVAPRRPTGTLPSKISRNDYTYQLEGSLTAKKDTPFSMKALERVESIIGDIVKGVSVTPTAGNTELQTSSWPVAQDEEAEATQRLARMIRTRIDWGVGENFDAIKSLALAEDLAASENGYHRNLLIANRDFIKEEIIGYIADQYPTLKYSRTRCRADVGHIIDALAYDLTYGGNWASHTAGSAYFSGAAVNNGGNLVTNGDFTAATDWTFSLDSNEDPTWEITGGAGVKITGAAGSISQTIVTAPGESYTIEFDAIRTAGTLTVDATNVGSADSLATAVEITASGSYTYTFIAEKSITRIRFSGDAAFEGSIDDVNADSPQKVATLAAYAHLKEIVQTIGRDITVTPTYGTGTQISGTSGNASSATVVADLMDDIITLVDGATVNITYPSLTGISAGLQADIDTIDALTAQLVAIDVPAFISTNFPNLTYDTAKCTRDIVLLLDATKYDFALGTTFASHIAAHAYLRRTSNKVTGDQKAATLATNEYIRQLLRAQVSEASAQAQVDATFGLTNDIIFGGSNEGSNTQVADFDNYAAVRMLELNKTFIAKEAMAFVDEYFKDEVTATTSTTSSITITSTAWLSQNMEIIFTGDTPIGSLAADTVYYVKDILSATEFTISSTIGGAALTQADDTGTMTVESNYNYNTALCERDLNAIVDGMKWDMVWAPNYRREYTNGVKLIVPANYKSKLAARYYINSVVGSQEEDFYYLRNGTGLRLQTMEGLYGDLTPASANGTSRPTAGAYASLDPGWGPDDERVWITARSPYVQNCTTFGYGAVGQKIDGSLHNGGNDSMVSNDFTQVISDGIGAWLTQNGRAEMVSVFTYYSHIGYLCETGGRARATNGNNSYGTFGSVAEGVDPDETPVTAIVDNRTQYNATVGNVVTDQSALLNFEFTHAGNNYTEVDFGVFGAGVDEEIIGDEFRDGAVFQVRIIDDQEVDDAGGDGYLLVSNTAQEGTTTQITLAATDGNLSSAYPGMKIVITGGAGAGQYGIIDTYDAGTKIATVLDDQGNAGWDHFVKGTSILAPNSTSTYQIEPAVSFSAPATSTTTGVIGQNDYNDVLYFETSAQYTGVTIWQGGTGADATFDVDRIGEKYYVSINNAGTGYARLDELILLGTDVGGWEPANNITITVTTVGDNGEIVDFDFTGIGLKGLFIAPSATNVAATSLNGVDWATTTLPAGSYTTLASGLINDGSSLFKTSRVLVAGTNNSNVAYSDDGANWNTYALPGGLTTTGTMSIAFNYLGAGVNRFVLINSADTDVVYSDDGGQNWTLTSAALPNTGYNCMTSGKGKWVALRSGTNETAYSDDGVTWFATTNLPATNDWVDIAWGNGRFVAIAATGTAGAYSLDGINWTAMTVPNPFGNYVQIAYGQGVFAAASDTAGGLISYSEDGINWSTINLAGFTGTGSGPIAFGNPDRVGKFVSIGASSATSEVADIRLGARARGRVSVANEKVFNIRINEPGSGYDANNPPTMTITDPNNTADVVFTVRVGDGSLATPTFVNRGTGFLSASVDVNETGSNGEADFFQDGTFIAVRRMTERPVPGSNIEFASLPGQYFKLVNVVSFLGTNDGSYTGFLQVSPKMTRGDAPLDGDAVEMRIRYSQVRLTGHDFLDIGTGGFVTTNYPNDPLIAPDQTKETFDADGGRVFFTATDQDGNFRVGDLFSIEQSTGVATLNAEAFNIAGLQELTLGEVTLGGNSASVNEFSTDPFFTANSDSVVPTQRAVKAYIEAQIGGGGATLNVNSITAGDIFIGSNIITTASGLPINITANINFTGPVTGYPVLYQYFLR